MIARVALRLVYIKLNYKNYGTILIAHSLAPFKLHFHWPPSSRTNFSVGSVEHGIQFASFKFLNPHSFAKVHFARARVFRFLRLQIYWHLFEPLGRVQQFQAPSPDPIGRLDSSQKVFEAEKIMFFCPYVMGFPAAPNILYSYLK